MKKQPKEPMGVVEATLTRRRKTIERRIAALQQQMGTFAGLEIELRACESQLADIDRAIEAVKG